MMLESRGGSDPSIGLIPRGSLYAEVKVCEACGASVVLVGTAESRATQRVALDPEPSGRGNYVIRAGLAELVAAEREPQDRRYLSHFATCPFTKRFVNERPSLRLYR